MQLRPVVDVELVEHLGEVVADGAVADVEALADSSIRKARCGEPGDLRLALGQLVSCLGGAPADSLPGGGELPRRPLGEGRETDRLQHPVRGSQLFPCMAAPTLAPQPLAIEEMGAGEVD